MKKDREYASTTAVFALNSSDCNFNLTSWVAVTNPVEESRAMQYVMLVTFVCLSHLYGCVQVIRHIALDQVDGVRYSLITIGIITSWDIFLCLFHFYGALITKVTIMVFVC